MGVRILLARDGVVWSSYLLSYGWKAVYKTSGFIYGPDSIACLVEARLWICHFSGSDDHDLYLKAWLDLTFRFPLISITPLYSCSLGGPIQSSSSSLAFGRLDFRYPLISITPIVRRSFGTGFFDEARLLCFLELSMRCCLGISICAKLSYFMCSLPLPNDWVLRNAGSKQSTVRLREENHDPELYWDSICAYNKSGL